MGEWQHLARRPRTVDSGSSRQSMALRLALRWTMVARLILGTQSLLGDRGSMSMSRSMSRSWSRSRSRIRSRSRSRGSTC